MHHQDIIRNKNQIKIEVKPAKSIGQCKYLGSVISTNRNADDNINRKIDNTAANFKKINKMPIYIDSH